MDLGMDKGASLAFIIVGPVMSVPSIPAVMVLSSHWETAPASLTR